MKLKDFMNSKGLGMEATLTVTHRRDNKTHTIIIADMLEEYHQLKLKNGKANTTTKHAKKVSRNKK